MASKDFNTIISELKNKEYHPMYFLYGEEPYFIDQITSYIEKNILTEEQKEFNQTILYGRDIDSLDLISEARRYPVMSEKTVVIVKEAQDISKINDFLSYAINSSPSTILVFAYKKKKVDKRKKIFKTLFKEAKTLESKKLYDNQIPSWINDYIQTKGYKISPKASLLLIEFLGQELSKIANALDKLCIIYPEGTTFTPSQIEKNIGISKDYNIFEYTKALGLKDHKKSFIIAKYFKENIKTNHPIMLVSSLFRYFTQLMIFHSTKKQGKIKCSQEMGISPYFFTEFSQAANKYSMRSLVKIISLLREYDLKSKGLGATGNNTENLIIELTYKILTF